ncbi:MAG: FAD-dependent oxidoreductase [Candidatus Ranarchaeia archaeon]
MKEYGLIVVGSGAGMNIASTAYEHGMTVAVVEHGPMGGTCLNRGCIPTKILTYPADIIADVQESSRLNIHATVQSVDFNRLMSRMRETVRRDSESQGKAVDLADGIDWYKETGTFVKDYVLKIGKTTITSPLIIIASGSRPFIPPIKGLESVNYLTNKTVLELTEAPSSMIIVGGGYIACEFGHFFAAVGTKVTIIGRNPYLVKNEDHDVSVLLKRLLSKRMTVMTNYEVTRAWEDNGTKGVVARHRDNGDELQFEAASILIATGRRSNADLLKPERSSVKLDKKGYIVVDEYFRTSKEGIWAFGDAIR